MVPKLERMRSGQGKLYLWASVVTGPVVGVPAGQSTIIVAQISLSLAVIGAELHGVVLFMAVATTVIAPPFLKLLYASEVAARKEIGPPDAGGIVASEDLCKIG